MSQQTPKITRSPRAHHSRWLGASVFALVSASSADAFASFPVAIDCYEPNVADTYTYNQITVSAWRDGEQIFDDFGVPDCDSLSDATYSLADDAGDYDAIVIQTNGDDAFWMDEIRAGWEGAPDTQSFGVDGGGGYCLSTDPNDGNGNWPSPTEGCHEALRFDMGTGAVTVVTPPPAPEQQWWYRVQVDCYDGNIDYADTANTIYVDFWNGATYLGWDYVDGSSCNWQTDDTYAVHTSATNVTHVTFETSGGDAHWMDEVYLWKDDGVNDRLLAQWGRDGGKGYCLSTDPGDAGGDWTGYVDGCHTMLEFDVNGSVYVLQ